MAAQVSPQAGSDCGTPSVPQKRKSGRRSWFTPNKMIKYDIAVEPHRSILDVSEDGIETLELTHFTRPPRVDFGKCKVGKQKIRQLRVHNPNDYDQNVVIEKFPFKKNFSVNLTEFMVEGGDDLILTLTWTPQEAGNSREMLLFKIDGTYRLQGYVFGSVPEPPKPKKSKVTGSKVQVKSGNVPYLKKKSPISKATKRRSFGKSQKPTGKTQQVQKKLGPQFSTHKTVNPTSGREFRSGDILRHATPNQHMQVPENKRRSTFTNNSPKNLPNTPTIAVTTPPGRMTKNEKGIEDMKENTPPRRPIPRTPSSAMRRSNTYTKMILHYTPPTSPQEEECLESKAAKDDSLSAYTPKYFDNLLEQSRAEDEPSKSSATEDSSPLTSFLEDSLMTTDVGVKKAMVEQKEKPVADWLGMDKSLSTCIGSKQLLHVDTELKHRLSSTPIIASRPGLLLDEVDGEVNPRRISTMTVTKSKAAVLKSPLIQDLINENCADNEFKPRNALLESPPIEPVNVKRFDSATVTKSKPAILINPVNKGDVCEGKKDVSTQSQQDRFVSTNQHKPTVHISPKKRESHCEMEDEEDSGVRPLRKKLFTSMLDASDNVLKTPGIQSDSISVHLHFGSSVPESIACNPVKQVPIITSELKKPDIEVLKRKMPPPPLHRTLKKSPNEKWSKPANDCSSSMLALSPGAEEDFPVPPSISTGRLLADSKKSGPGIKSNTRPAKSQSILGDISRSVSVINKTGNATTKSVAVTQAKPRVERTKLGTGKSGNKPKPSRPTSFTVPRPVKGLGQSKLMLMKKASKSALPQHPLPFAAKNMYYDERWMEKQERGFVRWLNFVLTPPEEYVVTKCAPKVDAGKLTVDSSKQPTKVAPTKEALSYKTYSARRRMDRLRRKSCELFQSDQMITVIRKLELEIECRRLLIREDRKTHADLGLKQKLLDMILCYNPLWLRIGLETVYGEILPVHSNTDFIGISRFILTRLLGCPDIARNFAHPKVINLYKKGYEGALKQYTLKKFLLLVLFLDQAKMARIIDYDPCLFCVDAPLKASKDILLSFSRDFLSGEGDFTKHLSYLGYKVSYSQSYLDEYDYAVTTLSTDLRDGVKLTRIVELLMQTWELSKKLRVPAISRLQKIHNVDVALKSMVIAGIDLLVKQSEKLTSRDIVDGHKEKTLMLLWKLVYKFQVEFVLSEELLREEISFLERHLKTQRLLQLLHDEGIENQNVSLSESLSEGLGNYADNNRILLLLKWCKAVCAYYNMKVENFTVAFSDGRAFCYILHHYHPCLLPLSAIKQETTQTFNAEEDSPEGSDDDSIIHSWAATCSPSSGKPSVYEELLSNEKENFRMLQEKVSELGGIPMMLKQSDLSNTIPDEKVIVTFVSCLCARLLDIRLESRAARKIQCAWRNYLYNKQKQQLKERHQAAYIIQTWVRNILARKKCQKEQYAAVCIQRRFRGYIVRKQFTMARKEAAAVQIQRFVRGYLQRQELIAMNKAAVTIQCMWRMHQGRIHYFKVQRAALFIQKLFRGKQQAREERDKYTAMKKAATTIQIFYRRRLSRMAQQRLQAVVIIQAHCRGFLARLQHKTRLQAIVKLQACTRGWLARSHYLKLIAAVNTIQKSYRSYKNMCITQQEYENIKVAAICIQSNFRRHQAQQRYRKVCNAVLCIQTHFRGYRAKIAYRAQKYAACTIQKYYRSFQQARAQRKTFVVFKAAVCVLQRAWRQRQQMVEEKRHRAATCIQSALRGYVQRQNYLELRHAVIIIQSGCRMFLARRNHIRVCSAVVIIQSHFRAKLERQKFRHKRMAAILIQSSVRGHQARNEFVKKRHAAIVLQRHYRSLISGRQQRLVYHVTRGACIAVQTSIRGWLARSRYQKMRSSTIILQSHFRRYLAEKEYKQVKDATLVIQKLCRRKQAKNKFSKMKASAILLQSAIRAYQGSQRYRVKLRCIRKIQTCYRGYAARQQYQTTRTACIVLQSYIRMHLTRQRYLQHLQAVLTIQKAFRNICLTRTVRQNYDATRKAAIVLQSHIRGYLCRKQLVKMHQAALTIQSFVRAFLTQQHFLRTKAAAIILQHHYRARLSMLKCRRQYLDIRVAVIKIQSWSRMQQCRNKYTQQKYAAITIQSAYRGFAACKHYKRLKIAAISIQRGIRNYHTMKSTRQAYLRMRAAVVKIQAFVRGKMCRQLLLRQHGAASRIQAYFRGYSQRRHFHKQCWAISVLQTRFKAMNAGKQERCKYQRLRTAAIIIQSYWQGYLVRSCVRRVNRAATLIQSTYRMYRIRAQYKNVVAAKKLLGSCPQSMCLSEVLAGCQGSTRSEAWGEEILQQAAATLLQSIYKMIKIRQEFLAKKNAITILQAHCRAWLQMKRLRAKYLGMKSAAVSIQTWYKTCMERRAYLMQKSAAIKIQANFRGWKCRMQLQRNKAAVLILENHMQAYLLKRRAESKFQTLKKAAVSLQTIFRARRERRAFLQKRSAAIVIQACVRGWQCKRDLLKLRAAVIFVQHRLRAQHTMKVARANFISKRQAAVTIQSAFRGSQQRQKYQHLRSAAITIQSHFRGWKCNQELLRLKAATMIIQDRYRGKLAMKKAIAQYQLQKQSAMKIQASFRGFQQQRRYMKVRNAVTTLQSAYRGWKCRQECWKRTSAAIVIQTMWRSKCHSDKVRQHFFHQKNAVTKIQAFVRAFQERRRYEKLKAAVIVLQAYYRGKRQRQAYLALKRATLTMQERYRSNTTARAAVQEYQAIKKSCITLQATYRAVQQRRIFKKMRNAVLLIQRLVRGRKCRGEYIQTRQAAVKIQQFYRAVRQRNQQRHAAIVIQSAYRCHKQRQIYRNIQIAAVVLQSAFRGYRCRMELQRKGAAALIIQHHFRESRKVKDAVQQFQRHKQAIMTIQSAFRGHRLHIQYKQFRDAVILLQAHIRAYFDRRAFLQKKSAAMVLQRGFRGHQQRKVALEHLHKCRQAAITIQSSYRLHRQRKQHLQFVHSTTILQAYIRGYQCRRKFQRMKSAAVIIQCHFRSYKQMKADKLYFHQCKEAAMVIQSAFRAHYQQVHYLLRITATVKIQSYVRAYQCRTKFLKLRAAALILQSHLRATILRNEIQEEYRLMKQAAITIQSGYRGYIQRRSFLNIRNATLSLQAQVRGYYCRKEYNRVRTAVVVIQHHTRDHLARRLLRQQRQAAICIQSHYRGFRTRKTLEEERKARAFYLQQLNEFNKQFLSAMIIQRWYRQKLVIRAAKEKLEVVIRIQRWLRAKLQRVRYLKLQSGIRTFQKAGREWLANREKHAVILQAHTRGWLTRQHTLRWKNAIVTIQAFWRGHQERERMRQRDRRLTIICKRAQTATRNATEEKKLCNKTTSALDYLLKYKQLSYILEALMNLDVATRLSWRCCERLVDGNAVPVLYRLISSCNRSIPHMELIKYSLSILINLSKYDKTASAVWGVENSAETLTGLMQIYREKGTIFIMTCTLLGILGQDNKRKMDLQSEKKLCEKMRSIHKLTERKHKMEQKRSTAKAKMSASMMCSSMSASMMVTSTKLRQQPKFAPAWNLMQDRTKDITDSMQAIDFVIETFQL